MTTCRTLGGARSWRAAKFTNPRAGATVETLTDREGKQANTIAEKKEMLRGESFPLNDGDQYYELPPASQAHECITEQSVERALFSQSVKKAPGADNISKKHFRPGGMAPSEWTRSVRAVRGTPVADYSTPGVNATRRVAYCPPNAVSPFLLAQLVS